MKKIKFEIGDLLCHTTRYNDKKIYYVYLGTGTETEVLSWVYGDAASFGVGAGNALIVKLVDIKTNIKHWEHCDRIMLEYELINE